MCVLSRFLIAAVIAWLVCLLPTTTYAQARQVYTDTIDLQPTDWSDAMRFPRFDADIGFLTGVEFVLDGRLQGQARFESLDAQATQVTVGMSANVALQRPNGSTIIESIPVASVTEAVSAFDGVIDFAGESGRLFPRLVGIHIVESDIFTEATDLTLFTGEGSILLPVNASGRASGQGGGNLALSYITEASAFVTVTYLYQGTSVDLEKFTNGEDADDAPGVFLAPGDPVTWTYIVTNTGTVDLEEVVILDDQEGTISCPGTTLAAGDTMLCTLASTTGAQVGQYTNVATVTAKTPDDGVNPRREVHDSDPSNYYASTVSLCPLDGDGHVETPDIQFLGFGHGTYILPDEYDVFIVKRRISTGRHFHFETVLGEVNAGGERVLDLPVDINPRQDIQQRVWACTGDCDFVAHVDGPVELGYLEPGITIGAVVIDDDNDKRVNRWVGEVNGVTTEYPIEEQVMVQHLIFEIPMAANWSYYAADSVGIVHVCIMPPGLGWSPDVVGPSGARRAGNADSQPNRQLFLPTIFASER